MQPLAGSALLIANPNPVIAGGNQFTRLVLQPFVTTDATPTTPLLLQRTLALNTHYVLVVEGHASAADGSVFEFNARNAWSRTAGGSVRIGTSAGDAIDVTPDADGYELRSMDPAGAVLGTEIVICNNSGTRSFTLMHDHASGTAGGRFFFADDLDHVLAPHEQVWGVLRDADGRAGWWMQF